MTETEAGTETGIEGDGSNESAIEGQIKLNLLLPWNEFKSLHIILVEYFGEACG